MAIQVAHRVLVPNSLDTVCAYFSSLQVGVELWHGGISAGIQNGLHLRAAKELNEGTSIVGVAVNPKYLVPLTHSQVMYGGNGQFKRCKLPKRRTPRFSSFAGPARAEVLSFESLSHERSVATRVSSF